MAAASLRLVGSVNPAAFGICVRTPHDLMSTGVMLTFGLVGLYMAVVLDALIYFGKQHYHSTVIGSSIGLSAFALMLVVAAFESRSVSLSTLASETFDNPQMNWTAIAEIALAVMITQMDLFNRLLKTTPLTAPQFGLALASAVLLLALWRPASSSRADTDLCPWKRGSRCARNRSRPWIPEHRGIHDGAAPASGLSALASYGQRRDAFSSPHQRARARSFDPSR
jgi:hypothetical protein